ncbi:MAG: hypothetical protein PHS79_05475 [Patescibacteria group bacterium]|nr:hypothetical protein [Patescibacteria group bacterium]
MQTMHRPSPQSGVDIFESKPVVSSNRRAPDWLLEMSCEAYRRAVRVFDHLPLFQKYCALPQLMHHQPETVERYLEFADPKLPVLWFMPEGVTILHLVNLGLQHTWWRGDLDVSGTPTYDPNGTSIRSMEDGKHAIDSSHRGGYWVLWQPRLLPLSEHATLQEQRWLMSQFARLLKIPPKEVVLGDLAEQAVLWVQARAEKLISNFDFHSVRTDAGYRKELIHGDGLRASDVSCGIGYVSRGPNVDDCALEVTDYGNSVRITGLGISPIVI